MSKIQVALSASSDQESRSDRFKTVMQKFFDGYNPKVQQLLKDVKDVEAECEKIAIQFGEPGNGQTGWESFFLLFKEFMELWTDGEGNIKRSKELAAKEEKRRIAEDNKKKAREDLEKKVSGVSSSAAGVADQLFDELVAADPKAVMEQIKLRRQQKSKAALRSKP
jgi:hypothetical protein